MTATQTAEEVLSRLDWCPTETCMAKDCTHEAEWRAWLALNGTPAGEPIEVCTPHEEALEAHFRHCPVCSALDVVAERI